MSIRVGRPFVLRLARKDFVADQAATGATGAFGVAIPSPRLEVGTILTATFALRKQAVAKVAKAVAKV